MNTPNKIKEYIQLRKQLDKKNKLAAYGSGFVIAYYIVDQIYERTGHLQLGILGAVAALAGVILMFYGSLSANPIRKRMRPLEEELETADKL